MAKWLGLALFVALAGGCFLYFYTPASQNSTQLSNAGDMPLTSTGSATGISPTPTVATSVVKVDSLQGVQTTDTSPAAAIAGSTYGHIYTDAELLAMAGPVDLMNLPLGDGEYTTNAPKKGYVYICHVATGGQGAQVNGPWIHGTTWDQTTKVFVQGSVPWPDAYASFTLSGSTRLVNTNDEPTNSTTGIFPIPTNDPAYQYDGNHSSITAQTNVLSLPAYPSVASVPNCIYGEVGTMTNGVRLNDAFDALYRDAPAHEELDSCDGHPNDQEGYHYHNLSSCFKTPAVNTVIGYADDGFPITGPQVSSGNYLSTNDLDECHGLTSTITEDGKQVTTYHYVMTYDFPYSVSCFRGKSYEPHPGGGGQSTSQQSSTSQTQGAQGSGSQNGPPQAAIDACTGKSANSACTVTTPNGTITGTCRTPPNSSLACVPN